MDLWGRRRRRGEGTSLFSLHFPRASPKKDGEQGERRRAGIEEEGVGRQNGSRFASKTGNTERGEDTFWTLWKSHSNFLAVIWGKRGASGPRGRVVWDDGAWGGGGGGYELDGRFEKCMG